MSVFAIRRFSLRRAACLICLATFVIVAGNDRADAQARSLDDAMNSLADKVAKYLDVKKEDSIQVGNFDGPATSTSGPKIRQLLVEKLKAKEIRTTGGIKVSGDFFSAREGNAMIMRIVAQMKDRGGAPVQDFNIILQDEAANIETVEDASAVSLISTNVDTTDAKDFAQKADQIEQAIKKPEPAATGAVLFPKEGSNFGMEVLIRNAETFVPLPVKIIDGAPFIDPSIQDEIAVRLINNADHDVAVKITLDGFNMFDFSENPAFKKLGMVVIPRKSSGMIKGWHRNNERSDAFLIAEPENSELRKAGREEGEMGAISASFFACWDPATEQPPEVELLGKAQGVSDKGLTRGRDLEAKYRTVVREFGRTLLAVVSVRYAIPQDPVDLPSDTAPGEEPAPPTAPPTAGT